MKLPHIHKVQKTSAPLPFFGPVSGRENPKAHGGVRYEQECRCGAVRSILVNGLHREIGHWYMPEDL